MILYYTIMIHKHKQDRTLNKLQLKHTPKKGMLLTVSINISKDFIVFL